MTLPRREVLRCFSLGSVAPVFAPFLRSVGAHADGAAPPQRFVFVIKASGVDKSNLVPEGLGALGDAAYAESRDTLVDASLEALPKMLAPLAKFRDKLTIVQGLSGQNYKGNHTSGYGTLSCHNSELVPIAPTVDALLGMKHSTGPYPMFGMATNGTLRGQVSKPDDAYVYPKSVGVSARPGRGFPGEPDEGVSRAVRRSGHEHERSQDEVCDPTQPDGLPQRRRQADPTPA